MDGSPVQIWSDHMCVPFQTEISTGRKAWKVDYNYLVTIN